MKIDWKLLIIIILTLPCVWLFGRYVYSDEKRTDNKIELLEVCERLVKEHTTESLLGIPPKIVPVGGGGIHSTSQPLVLWRNDEFKVDVRCLGRNFGPSQEVIVDQFVVNGEDLTELVRREERKK